MSWGSKECLRPLSVGGFQRPDVVVDRQLRTHLAAIAARHPAVTEFAIEVARLDRIAELQLQQFQHPLPQLWIE